MRNLPTMMVLVEHSKNRNVRLCTRCLLCGSSLEAACTCGSARCNPMNGARPNSTCTRGSAPTCKCTASYGTLQVQSQLWDSAILKQWPSAIATLSLRAAHMGLAGPHNMGAKSDRCCRSHRRSGWPMPGLERAPSRPARGQGATWRGHCGTFNCTSRRSDGESQGRP